MIRIYFLFWKFLIRKNFDRSEVWLPPGPRVFIFLAADYGNLGDVAITEAQSDFLSATFPGHSVFLIPISKTLAWISSIRSQIKPDDVITLIGGGNMGTAYPDIEALRRLVIHVFPGSRIIAFPQSIDLNGALNYSLRVRIFLRAYIRHKNIIFALRESRSRDLVYQVPGGREHVLYVPDIVLSAHYPQDSDRRYGAILSLRNDRERSRSSAVDEEIGAALDKRFCQIECRDTETGVRFQSRLDAASALTRHLKAYSGAELVVTDRLHGMILAERSGTPVLVLDNSNQKISSTYRDWLQEHPRVSLLQPGEDVGLAIDALLSAAASCPIDYSHNPHFAPLVAALRGY